MLDTDDDHQDQMEVFKYVRPTKCCENMREMRTGQACALCIHCLHLYILPTLVFDPVPRVRKHALRYITAGQLPLLLGIIIKIMVEDARNSPRATSIVEYDKRFLGLRLGFGDNPALFDQRSGKSSGDHLACFIV